MKELNEKYQTHFPLGAGKNVDEFLVSFIKTHSLEETKNIVKAHFENFKKLEFIKIFNVKNCDEKSLQTTEISSNIKRSQNKRKGGFF